MNRFRFNIQRRINRIRYNLQPDIYKTINPRRPASKTQARTIAELSAGAALVTYAVGCVGCYLYGNRNGQHAHKSKYDRMSESAMWPYAVGSVALSRLCGEFKPTDPQNEG